ncbi:MULTISPECIES: bifunctional 2-polyprenyl-6-hydroxyphenol methylase/3-demethylubiquinol 3-O-methyltransferase UbiG [unclassified Mycolicibacterium]|uniref:class I SAM-dependent methyltransferase n=1 Tax=unclassified Mycolicibacterium TaxID=2636767 RepID=UPI0012DE4B8C|nr:MULTISPECIES: class I SAM-dependent methyltransferase [unclassified Mycolicibacterium]MUL85786.1 class I SAM-dependent methyltransferase [Mycolicibacterium sp. CBMA 329]MUL90156.1 class I SAM-dependent methyltransferase [Mycolicibacterium sp. CBMA 331]MUM00925.1 class I SAM-dependent methyltransferase [Mycolicibacterium sp. CBMA 334]MUM27465.1 class I SAM-dependent methyltransferase [Mycolicibacterium sp. CBMA 295]MUM39671.1 class I SAM-dependent methyltransferase [Mycolicibacterium sp. CBM
MSSRQRLYRWLYRLGFTPWDGHPLAHSLTDLIEGGSLSPGTALDLGCGTGDNAVYLARHGWQVTGVDYVDKPLAKARVKAGTLPVNFVKADVTQLSSSGIGANFGLVIDSGCLHGMSAADRDAYAREVSAVAAPGTRLLIVAFIPGGSPGVPGIGFDEVQRRFSHGWTLLSSGDEPAMDHNGKNPARFYLFSRSGAGP